MKRNASAIWKGDLKQGSGSFKAQSGAFSNMPFSFATRFENQAGTNPEELIAAALASCYSMALSAALSGAGKKVEEISTDANLSLDQVEGQWTITGIHLETKAKVSGLSDEKFQEAANKTKESCPVSRALQVPITLTAFLT